MINQKFIQEFHHHGQWLSSSLDNKMNLLPSNPLKTGLKPLNVMENLWKSKDQETKLATISLKFIFKQFRQIKKS